MKLDDALDASPLHAALNATGSQVVMVRRYPEDNDRLESFVEHSDTHEFKHAPINHPAYVGVDSLAWEPVTELPAFD